MNEQSLGRQRGPGEFDEVVVVREEEHLRLARQIGQTRERRGSPRVVELDQQVVDNQR